MPALAYVVKGPGSPQTASLGCATQLPLMNTVTGIVPRRNSLGDLKIPTRISRAQVGLKRDLGMVWEFVAEVKGKLWTCHIGVAHELNNDGLQGLRNFKAFIKHSL